MITVGMNYKIIPGKDDEFIAVFKKVIHVMSAMPGHTVTHLYRDVDAQHDYLIVSEWSDRAAFDAFIASEQFKGVANWGKLNVLAGRPTHQVYGDEPTPKPTAPTTGQCPAGHH
jgi:heme-degrading monooxygenase HmoA